MTKYWYITGDFLAERKRRIGASDIPALIPNPDKPTESLAGYGRTPVTVWQEKTGRLDREPPGLPAEMGHYLEGKAVELFIRTFSGADMARAHYRDRASYDFIVGEKAAAAYQKTPYRHNVQFHRDGMIVHPDAVYDPALWWDGAALDKVTKQGITVDTSKPFLIEAKSASYWSAKRPEGSVVNGYDPKLKTWHGIPLGHYMQIQFQLALMEVDVAYLSLIHNTNQWDVWQIRANKRHQGKLIDLAGTMVKRIETDTPPSDLAMNTDDIKALYPEVGEDFVTLAGPERDTAVEIAKSYQHADRQEKRWKERKSDAQDAMAVLLKDRPELRDGEGVIAKWQKKSGAERVVALKTIKNEHPLAYKYLKRNKLLQTSKDSRTVTIPWKGGDE